MNRFRKAATIIIITEVLIIIVLNVIYLSFIRDSGKYYRVEAERVVRMLEGDSSLRENPEGVDISGFSTIIRVSHFNSSEICNNDYVVEEVDGTPYRIEYKADKNSTAFLLMNIGMAAGLLLTVGVFIYIGMKVIKPFDKMSSLTQELAKGNLSAPIKEERSRLNIKKKKRRCCFHYLTILKLRYQLFSFILRHFQKDYMIQKRRSREP